MPTPRRGRGGNYRREGVTVANDTDENLTLRDRFALAALAGLASIQDLDTDDTARIAYQFADAMVRERSGEAEQERQAEKAKAKAKAQAEKAQAETAPLFAAGWTRSLRNDGDERWTPPGGVGWHSRAEAVAKLDSSPSDCAPTEGE